ncbi:MAG: DUF3667 domain-containing protein [Flavobacteriales bacterium]|nr:DUF3667 domain-containing protein [Flavobacteriales bacterium]
MKSITRFTRNIRGDKCLNCENDISENDNFCSQCGQVNDLQKVSLKQYLSAYFDDFFSFDSRLLNTIAALIFKPGYVSKNYIDGMRMRYINPFKLYLQVTILFFLVVGVFKTIDQFKPVSDTSSVILSDFNAEDGREAIDSIKSETLKELEKNDVKIDSNTLSLIESGISGFSLSKDSIQKLANKQRNDNKLLMAIHVDSIAANVGIFNDLNNETLSFDLKDSLILAILISIDKKAKELTNDDKNVMVNQWSEFEEGWDEVSKKGKLKKFAVKHLDSVFEAREIVYEIPLSLIRISDEGTEAGSGKKLFIKIKSFMEFEKEFPKESALAAIDKLGYKESYWNVFLYSKSTDWNEAVEDPSNYGAELIDRILSRVSVALFFLLPVFTLIVSLLYIRRKFNYTENLVFVFHVQTVFFLLLLLFFLIGRLFHSDGVVWIFLIIFMIHLYMSMRRFYEQGRFKTFIKYIILNTGFMFLALIGGSIISFIAFML